MAFRMNRRPIGRIPFPPWIKRRRKPRFTWDTSIWAGTGQNVAGAVSEFQLADYADYAYTTGAATQVGPHKIHRVQLKGHWLPTWDVAAQAMTGWIFGWAIYTADGEDTDINFWAGADNLFANHQVLKWDVVIGNVQEVPAAQVSDHFFRSMRINVDLKFRRPVLLRAGHELRLGAQFANSIATIVPSMAFHGIQRMVVQPAGMGR